MAAQTAPAHTYVQYFVPLDGDNEDAPNAFLVKKDAKAMRLQDIQQSFPLPGTYFFRAKAAFGKTHVWLDLNAPEDPIPAFNGKIVLKVSRLTASSAGSSGAASSAPTHVKSVSNASAPRAPAAGTSQAQGQAPATAPAPSPSTTRSEQSADMLGLFGDAPKSTGSVSGPSPSPTHSSSVGDIFSIQGGASSPAAGAPRPMQNTGAAATAFDTFGGVNTWGSPPPAGMMGAAPRGMPMGAPRPMSIGGAPRGGPIGGGAATPSPAAASKPASGSILDGDIFNM